MKKLLFFMFAMLVCPNLHAQKLQVRVDSLSASINWSNVKIENLNVKMEDIEGSIEGLTKQVENLSYLVEAQKEVISQEQSAIENSMGAVNTLLAIFSLIITIGGIFLGWFINRKEKNVQALLMQVESKKKEVEKLEEKTAKTKGEIEELNDSINNDIEGLYAKLRREETITLLKRLVYEPNDVINISQLLLSRDLGATDFKYLLAAYRNIELKNGNGRPDYIQSIKMGYLILFYQHFCGQALCHELVSADLINSFPELLAHAFKNDVINSTKSLVNCFNQENVSINKVEITYLYLQALHNSQFSNLKDAYDVIALEYRNDEELKGICRRLADKKIYIKPFNEFICDRYKEDLSFVELIKAQESVRIVNVKELKKRQNGPNRK